MLQPANRLTWILLILAPEAELTFQGWLKPRWSLTMNKWHFVTPSRLAWPSSLWGWSWNPAQTYPNRFETHTDTLDYACCSCCHTSPLLLEYYILYFREQFKSGLRTYLMKWHTGTPSGGPRAHLLTEAGYNNWAKHPLKKAEESQENKGLHRAALTLILLVLHNFNCSAPFVYVWLYSQWYVHLCMHLPEERRAVIKHTWQTPTVPSTATTIQKPVPLDGAEQQNSSQAMFMTAAAAALPKSQVATCFLLTGH